MDSDFCFRLRLESDSNAFSELRCMILLEGRNSQTGFIQQISFSESKELRE